MKRTLQVSAPPPTNGGQLQKQNIVKDTNFPQYAPQFAVCNPCRPSYELTAQQAKDENSMNENAQRLPLDLMRIPTTDDQYLEPPTGNKNPPIAHELEDIALEHNKNPVEQQKLLTPQIITNEKERMKDEVDHVRVAENVQPAVNSDLKQGAKVDQKLYQPNDAAGNKGTKPAMLQKDQAVKPLSPQKNQLAKDWLTPRNQAVKPLTPQKDQLAKDWLTPKNQAVKPLTPQKDQLAKDWLTPRNQAVKPLTQKDQLAKESLTPRNQAVKPLTQKDQLAKESLTPRNQAAKPLTPQKDQLAKDSLTPRNQAVKPLTSQEDQLAKESLTPRNQAAKPLTPQKDQLAKQSLTLEDQGFKGTPPQKATPQQPMRTQMAPSNEDEKRAMKTTIEHQAVHLIPEQIRSQTSMTESKQNTNTTEWTLKSDETLLSAGTSSSLNTAAERTSRKEELPPSSPAVYCSNSSSCEVEEKNGRKSPKFVDSVYFPAGHF
ncbi:hypothetical protein AB6A40_006189 [Gnathostoma spinigerum]|uniref:Uncharacterized protein n=1 Tax=Gnathostoma spinigerum TaxID=75299 RepID=A0ABD6EIT4_9BILA